MTENLKGKVPCRLQIRRQLDAKVPIKKPFIHKITAEAWHGYNQEIRTENTGAMPKQIVISNLICFKIPRFIHSVFRSCIVQRYIV